MLKLYIQLLYYKSNFDKFSIKKYRKVYFNRKSKCILFVYYLLKVYLNKKSSRLRRCLSLLFASFVLFSKFYLFYTSFLAIK